jgi:predicted nucleotidyltransferase
LDIQEEKELVKRETSDRHWRWRLNSVERIAAHLDPKRFGVEGLYIFGSTKDGTAGPRSDIDLIIHFRGSEAQKRDLLTWLEGWSLSLAQANYHNTGYQIKEILDIHFVSDEDIEKRTSYAVKIGAVTDAARPLALATALEGE